MTAAVKDNDGSGKKRKEIPSGEAFHDIGNGKALPSSIPSSSLGRVLSVLFLGHGSWVRPLSPFTPSHSLSSFVLPCLSCFLAIIGEARRETRRGDKKESVRDGGEREA